MFKYKDLSKATGELKMTLIQKPVGRPINAMQDRRKQIDVDIKFVQAAVYPFGGVNSMALIMEPVYEWSDELDFYSRNARDKWVISTDFHFTEAEKSSAVIDLQDKTLFRFDYCEIWQTAQGVLPNMASGRRVQFLLLAPGSSWKLLPKPLAMLSETVPLRINGEYIDQHVKIRLENNAPLDLSPNAVKDLKIN